VREILRREDFNWKDLGFAYCWRLEEDQWHADANQSACVLGSDGWR
jgi:hypothetical protein